jgi:hypothetical protein
MMRTSNGVVRVVAVMALVGILAACGSDSTTSVTSSLAGNYKLQDFKEAGQDVMQAVQTGTATLTATTYKVNIVFLAQAGIPAVIDSGTYTATGSGSGSFSETSLVTGAQSTGTYTVSNGLWTVNVTSQGVAIAQVWQKQ